MLRAHRLNGASTAGRVRGDHDGHEGRHDDQKDDEGSSAHGAYHPFKSNTAVLSPKRSSRVSPAQTLYRRA
jgi:hypothetical protein